MENILGQLVITVLPEFQVGGKLRPFLRVCVASIILHFNNYKAKYGEDTLLVKKVISAAMKTNLTVDSVIDLSQKLSSMFTSKNASQLSPTPTCHDKHIDALRSELSSVKGELVTVKAELCSVNAKLDTLLKQNVPSPSLDPTPQTPKNSLTNKVYELRSSTPQKNSAPKAKVGSPQKISATKANVGSSVVQQMMRASASKTSVDTSSGITIADILINIAERGCLKRMSLNSCSCTLIPSQSKNKKKYERVMVYIDSKKDNFKQQLDILKDNPGQKQVGQAALDIQTIVMNTIRQEEGDEKKGNKVKPFYLGVSSRISDLQKTNKK